MAKLGLAIHEFGRETPPAGVALHHGQPAEWYDLCWRNERLGPPRLGASDWSCPGFTKRYGLKRLVYAEPHETMPSAILREKNVKSWPRAWRIRLITSANPNWDDLYETILQ
jgi:hypothetical protein